MGIWWGEAQKLRDFTQAQAGPVAKRHLALNVSSAEAEKLILQKPGTFFTQTQNRRVWRKSWLRLNKE